MIEKAYAASGLAWIVNKWNDKQTDNQAEEEKRTIAEELKTTGKLTYGTIASGRPEDFFNIMTGVTSNRYEYNATRGEGQGPLSVGRYTCAEFDKFNKVTGALTIKTVGRDQKGAFLVPRDTFLFMFESYAVINISPFASEEKRKQGK